MHINESLRDRNHTLVVSAHNTTTQSVILFDYISTAVDASVTARIPVTSPTTSSRRASLLKPHGSRRTPH